MAQIPLIYGYPITIPLGAITFLFLIITMLVGLSIQKGWVRIKIKYHIFLAVTTLILAIIHAAVVFYMYFL